MLAKRYSKRKAFQIDNNRPTLSIKNDLGQLPQKEREGIAVIYGHHYYGIHQYIPPPYTYFTILREPIERCISLYKELIRRKDSAIGQKIVNEKISLKQLIESGIYHEFDNDQCKRVAGYLPPYGTCNRKLFQDAILNIQKDFIHVGIQEYLDESLLLFSKQVRWKIPPYYIQLNRSVGEKKVDVKIDQETIDAIVKYNKWDILLYNQMKENIEKEIKSNKTLEGQVKRFRRQNKIFQKAANAYLDFKSKF